MTAEIGNPEVREPTEMEVLKDRARKLGVTFSNNIGLDALRQRVADKQEGKVSAPENEEDLVTAAKEAVKTAPEFAQPIAQVNALTGQDPAAPVKLKTIRQHLYDEQMKLVRLRITCLDPKKKDLHGELMTVANEYLGTVRKFIPFGEVTDQGYHVPYCLYKMLEARKFLHIQVRTDPRTKKIDIKKTWAREFALEVLDPLTPEELERLASAQIAAGTNAG